MKNAASSWFRTNDAWSRDELRLFCFPYAGGGAVIYRNWAEHLPAGVRVVPVELPGRGARLREPSFVHVTPLCDALAEAMLPVLDIPFALFGHSMGALIVFELARHLRRLHNREPEKLFVSGRRAPQLARTGPITYNLPKDELLQEIHRMNGTPKELLEHEELMELMLPLLSADLQLTQTYEYADDAPLRCPITVFGGLQDTEVSRELLLPWREQTSSDFELRMMPGDHFFLRSSQTLLLDSLARELLALLARDDSNK
jgi:medium-chain acyl-[acyl-carrier-protein] hydrolase